MITSVTSQKWGSGIRARENQPSLKFMGGVAASCYGMMTV